MELELDDQNEIERKGRIALKHRLKFAGKKLIRMLLLLLGVSLLTFLLMWSSPLDPLQTNVGQTALGSMTQEQIAELEAYWGVDMPISSPIKTNFFLNTIYY